MPEFLPWLGWALAPAFVALWWGERCRRVDSQRREERIPVMEPRPAPKARVRLEQSAVPQAVDVDEARERYVQEALAEGYSRDEAEADFAAMVERLHSDQAAS